MDTRRVFSLSSSTSDSSGEGLRCRKTWASGGIWRSMTGALGGVGMRSGVLSSVGSMKSLMEGKGRDALQLSVSLCCSTTTAAAGFGIEVEGKVILTCRQRRDMFNTMHSTYTVNIYIWHEINGRV